MTLGQEQEAFSRDLVSLISYAHSRDCGVRIGEVERTVEQQRLYVQHYPT